jgi:hypothetical protein
MQPKESWASVGSEELALWLRSQTDFGHPDAGTTSGLVAYLDGEARRLVRGRATHRLRAPSAQDTRSLGRQS